MSLNMQYKIVNGKRVLLTPEEVEELKSGYLDLLPQASGNELINFIAISIDSGVDDFNLQYTLVKKLQGMIAFLGLPRFYKMSSEDFGSIKQTLTQSSELDTNEKSVLTYILDQFEEKHAFI